MSGGVYMSKIARRRDVLAHLEKGPLTPEIIATLSHRHSCHPRTIRRDALTVRAAAVGELLHLAVPPPTIDEREEFLTRLRTVIGEVLASGRMGPIPGLMSLEARCRGFDKPVPLEIEVPPVPETPEEHRAQLLTSIRRLRLKAEASGSYVAAMQAARIEVDLARPEAGASDPLEGAPADELIETMVAAIGGMPRSMRDAIAVALSAA